MGWDFLAGAYALGTDKKLSCVCLLPGKSLRKVALLSTRSQVLLFAGLAIEKMCPKKILLSKRVLAREIFPKWKMGKELSVIKSLRN